MVEDSGVRCQEKNKKAETCWSEAAIPSEAKLQRGTLKPPSKPCNSGLALGTRFSRFQFFVIGVCVLHLIQLEVTIAVRLSGIEFLPLVGRIG